MRIGITSVSNVFEEWNSKDVADLKKAISLSGNTPFMIYADSLDIALNKGNISITQSSERASGMSNGREEINADAVLLRHLGTIRDYEQFTFRLFCIKSFEEKGIYVMNPVMNWLFATDKFGALLKLSNRGLPIPETIVSEHMFVAYSAVRKFGEAVIKPLRSAMGFGVFRVNDPDVAIHSFSTMTNMNKPLYVQKYFEKKGGGDYRAVVVGGELLGTEFRKGKTWKSNVAQGAVPVKVKADSELEELAIRSCEVLGLDYAGIDIAETSEGYLVLETNPTLSWQGFRKATGINPAKHIVREIISKAKK